MYTALKVAGAGLIQAELLLDNICKFNLQLPPAFVFYAINELALAQKDAAPATLTEC